MRTLFICALATIGVVPAAAQTAPSGDVATDFAVAADTTLRSRSPLLAGSLSAILPGAGQVYAGAPWWRSALYVAAEAGGWIMLVASTSSGDRRTGEFERFVDDHWSVVRYVQWIDRNIDRWSDDQVDRVAARSALARIYRDVGGSAPPWEQVDLEALHQLERSIRRGFSHTLPPHGEQQYFEQVGKYVQYRAGWDDHTGERDTAIFDATWVTPRNREYMDLRALANDAYSLAAAAVGALAINHVLSALDAVLTARSLNATVSVEPAGILRGIDESRWQLSLHVTF